MTNCFITDNLINSK